MSFAYSFDEMPVHHIWYQSDSDPREVLENTIENVPNDHGFGDTIHNISQQLKEMFATIDKLQEVLYKTRPSSTNGAINTPYDLNKVPVPYEQIKEKLSGTAKKEEEVRDAVHVFDEMSLSIPKKPDEKIVDCQLFDERPVKGIVISDDIPLGVPKELEPKSVEPLVFDEMPVKETSICDKIIVRSQKSESFDLHMFDKMPLKVHSDLETKENEFSMFDKMTEKRNRICNLVNDGFEEDQNSSLNNDIATHRPPQLGQTSALKKSNNGNEVKKELKNRKTKDILTLGGKRLPHHFCDSSSYVPPLYDPGGGVGEFVDIHLSGIGANMSFSITNLMQALADDKIIIHECSSRCFINTIKRDGCAFPCLLLDPMFIGDNVMSYIMFILKECNTILLHKLCTGVDFQRWAGIYEVFKLQELWSIIWYSVRKKLRNHLMKMLVTNCWTLGQTSIDDGTENAKDLFSSLQIQVVCSEGHSYFSYAVKKKY